MAYQLHTMGREAQRQYDNQEDPRFAREELDVVALAALQASPRMLDETFGMQPDVWLAKAARLLDSGEDIAFAALCRKTRDEYVMHSIEDVADIMDCSHNEAISELLRRAAA